MFDPLSIGSYTVQYTSTHSLHINFKSSCLSIYPLDPATQRFTYLPILHSSIHSQAIHPHLPSTIPIYPSTQACMYISSIHYPPKTPHMDPRIPTGYPLVQHPSLCHQLPASLPPPSILVTSRFPEGGSGSLHKGN